jgi:hypothetical protein
MIDENVRTDEDLVKTHGFPDGPVFFRRSGEEYRDVVERVQPAVLDEDDCEIREEFKASIKSIVVKEFGGIDGLPDELCGLLSVK